MKTKKNLNINIGPGNNILLSNMFFARQIIDSKREYIDVLNIIMYSFYDVHCTYFKSNSYWVTEIIRFKISYC